MTQYPKEYEMNGNQFLPIIFFYLLKLNEFICKGIKDVSNTRSPYKMRRISEKKYQPRVLI